MNEQPSRPPDGAIAEPTLRSFLGYGVKRASLVIERDLNRVLRGHGFRQTTFWALALVIDNPAITQTQLAGALDIERSSCVMVVDELEKLGLVTRNVVEGDRRSHALRATAVGSRAFDKVRVEVESLESRLFAGLGERERAVLTDLLGRIEAAG